MNYKKMRESLNLIRDSNVKLNVVRIGSNESKSHASMKRLYCWFLKKSHKDFVTEAIFKTGGRADIFVPSEFRIIELAHSESDESLYHKSLMYPSGLKIEVVRC